MEYDRPLDSALFLEVSQKARDLWASQLARYHTQSVRGRQLAHRWPRSRGHVSSQPQNK